MNISWVSYLLDLLIHFSWQLNLPVEVVYYVLGLLKFIWHVRQISSLNRHIWSSRHASNFIPLDTFTCKSSALLACFSLWHLWCHVVWTHLWCAHRGTHNIFFLSSRKWNTMGKTPRSCQLSSFVWFLTSKKGNKLQKISRASPKLVGEVMRGTVHNTKITCVIPWSVWKHLESCFGYTGQK